MGRKIVERTLSGATSREVQDYEIRHRAVARRAAADGIVLLRNEGGLLPLSKETPVALYGAGAVQTVKGGSGSGDVNSRPPVSVWEGMRSAGYRITTESWLSAYGQAYDAARLAWKEEFWRRAGEQDAQAGGGEDIFNVYASIPFVSPAGDAPAAKAPEDDADTAVLALSRTAGEGADRFNKKGDYLLTDEETALLHAVCALYTHVILVLNTGGLIDLSFTEDPEAGNIDAILYLHQPGMEGGHALADVLSGEVTPSGKLTDTWALSYEDYPNAADFSHNNGNVTSERYVEGLYVGYRYFDTFEKPVRYGFGYGLSYTQFDLRTTGIVHYGPGTSSPKLGVKVRVANTGSRSGKEVVQIYVACPQERQEKELRRLVGFGKTTLLSPGESQELEVVFPVERLASYDESLPGWVMEPGEYILLAGSSLAGAEPAGMLVAQQALVFEQTEHICAPGESIRECGELTQSDAVKARVAARRAQMREEIAADNCPVLYLHEGDVRFRQVVYDGAYDNTPQEVRDFVDTLSTEQLILLATGDVAKGQNPRGDEDNSQLGSAGAAVPGSAAQTSDCAAAQGLADIVLADGPAGLRLSPEYDVVNGRPRAVDFLTAIEGGFLLRQEDRKTLPYDERRYQYCTAFPVGTLLAQTWDQDLLQTVGAAAGEELVQFGVTLWLAPGMNIHRNPLCGRNFEYYSEDPVLSGLIAAAETRGVQSVKGVGTTIKHFACNNQEDNRRGSDSILSERVLREIYLKGFEIAVKESQPMSIMTSYNLVNGVHSANSYDLCTKAARCEWGFRGVIMTDWTTTIDDPSCTASGCMWAGNDLVMPGEASDHENIRQELTAGTLSIRDLKRSVARLVNIVWQSNYTAEE